MKPIPPPSTLWTRWGKRVFDVVAGGVLLLVLLPLMVLAAVCVKLTSAGPVFFLQKRVGRNGGVFRPWKFRTMRGERVPDPAELVPLDHADITPFGRILRRFKIDELPQLLNVVRGQMSLVGPRPTLPDQVAAYDEFRRQRLLVRPGITGLAQVNGNTSMSWDERILYDVAYVRRCSLGLDLAVLFRTVLVVVLGEKRLTRRFADSPYSRFVSAPEGYFSPRRREDHEEIKKEMNRRSRQP